jgi:hypothetical protein
MTFCKYELPLNEFLFVFDGRKNMSLLADFTKILHMWQHKYSFHNDFIELQSFSESIMRTNAFYSCLFALIVVSKANAFGTNVVYSCYNINIYH